MTYAHHHIGSTKAGGFGHDIPERGACFVEYDSRQDHYRVPRGQRRDFRKWLQNVWQETTGYRAGFTVKIAGSWPRYYVERR